jgi:hypothetical protein
VGERPLMVRLSNQKSKRETSDWRNDGNKVQARTLDCDDNQ